jgi:hypothetical protein
VRALLALILIAFAAGCSATPERAEGRVAYRDRKDQKTGKGGAVQVTVTTAKEPRPDEVRISPEEMGKLLADLEAIGLFKLSGVPEAPPSTTIPPGFIGVDTDRRKFYVGMHDLTSGGDVPQGPVFSRSAFRIIDAAQHGGIHIGLEK